MNFVKNLCGEFFRFTDRQCKYYFVLLYWKSSGTYPRGKLPCPPPPITFLWSVTVKKWSFYLAKFETRWFFFARHFRLFFFQLSKFVVYRRNCDFYFSLFHLPKQGRSVPFCWKQKFDSNKWIKEIMHNRIIPGQNWRHCLLWYDTV